MNKTGTLSKFHPSKVHSRSFEHFQNSFLNEHKEDSFSLASLNEPNWDKNIDIQNGETIKKLSKIDFTSNENMPNSSLDNLKETIKLHESKDFFEQQKWKPSKEKSESLSYEGNISRHLSFLCFPDFSEALNFRDKELKIYNNNLLEFHLKNEDSTVLPFVKSFVNKLKNACSVRKIMQMKPANFQILADSSCYFEEVEKKQEMINATFWKKILLVLRNCYENKFYQIKKNRIINICNIFLGDRKMVIHPYHYMKLLWDLIHLMMIITWFFYIPLVMAFEEVHLVDFSFCFYTSIFLSIDILLSCNTAFFKNGMIETSRIRIFIHYFKMRFFLDMITLFPILLDLILRKWLEYEDYESFILFHFLKFLFFLKMTKMNEITQRINERFLLQEKFQNIISLFKVFFVSILVAHLFACFWYFASVESKSDSTWLSKANLMQSPWDIKYLYSMYWACVTMMTVGYGDITPQNEVEIIVCIISVVLGCAVYAYNISSIGMLLQDLNKENAEFDHNINIINQYMNKKNIHRDLQMRIREYLRFLWKEENTQNLEDEQRIIGILSNSLREELLLEAYGDILKRFPMFFANFTEKSLRRVVTIIKDIKLFPEEKIFLEKEDDDYSIYFIMKGKVNISTESGIVVKELGVGEHFGEIAFFSGKPRKLSAKSKDFTTLFSINREEFIKVLMKNSDDFEKFCMIKDQILLYENYLPLKTRCYSCNQIGHLSHKCPLIHFIPDQEKVIKKFNFYLDQKRQTPFIRKKLRMNSLAKKKKMEVANKRIKIEIEREKAELMKAVDEECLSLNSSQHASFENFDKSEIIGNKENRTNSIQSDRENPHFIEMTNQEKQIQLGKGNQLETFNDIERNSSKILENFVLSQQHLNPEKNENIAHSGNDQNHIFLSADHLEEKSFVLNEELKSDGSVLRNHDQKQSKVVCYCETKKEIRKIDGVDILKGHSLQKTFGRVYENTEGKGKYIHNFNKETVQQATLLSQNNTNENTEGNCIKINPSVPVIDETIMDNFDRVAYFKHYFPEKNSKLLLETMNKKLSRLGSFQLTQIRKKSLEFRLSKYTFFPEEMKQKMPDQIKKRVRKALKQRKNCGVYEKPELKFSTKKKLKLDGKVLEEKFSNLVKFIMRSPTLKKILRKAKKKT